MLTTISFDRLAGVTFRLGDFSVFNMTFDSGLIRRVQFEIRRPIIRPRRQKLDAFAVALHEHELKVHHPGPTVVHVGNPIAIF